MTACGGAGQVRIAGHVIRPPDGYTLEEPATDFVCFRPKRDLAPLSVSLCARPITNRGVLAGNTFPITSYDIDEGEIQVRGLANDRSTNADTVYFIFEGKDLFLFGECLGAVRGSELVDRCSPHRLSFNDWVHSIRDRAA
ncbi:MAG: hypothetical protein ABR548_14015 [Actinomycetota bacterium]